jgi:hypothetical protein
MTDIITVTEVFDFMGTNTDVRTKNTSAVTALITNEQKNLEEMIGRICSTENVSAVCLEHNINCEIIDEYLFLKGKYIDLYAISAVTEAGTTISAVTAYGGSGYILDTKKGILKRINAFWNPSPYAILLTGSLGLNSKADIKQCLIEMVACKTGLWKLNVSTENGEITTIRTTISDDALSIINRYIWRGV